MRLIDEQGTQVGIVGVREAIQMAEERGFDLVEVAPNAVPPVCRLLDYGKFRYEQSKKEREARKNQKQAELKQIRLMPKTDDHDISVKANQAKRFLVQGDKVKFNVRFRGREMAHPEIGRKMLEAIAEQLREIAVVEQRPLMEGRVLSLLLAPTPKVLKAAQQAQKARQSQAKASGAGHHDEPEAAEVLEPDDVELDDEDFDDEDEEDDEADLAEDGAASDPQK
ncbi:translation initiation factor IF-3 [Candidatus Viridilinea mediisalina]|uniref:translation initiation factor IF-3 n=1 Tax=Candidatus Viridilinea mediisalina TaxID=2024553 RepID=UPI001FE4CB19